MYAGSHFLILFPDEVSRDCVKTGSSLMNQSLFIKGLRPLGTTVKSASGSCPPLFYTVPRFRPRIGIRLAKTDLNSEC